MIMEVKLSEESEDKLAERIVEKLAALNNKTNSKKKPEEKKFYKVSDIASVTGQANSTITRHINDGILPAKKIGQPWFVTEENYKKYINEQSPDHEQI